MNNPTNDLANGNDTSNTGVLNQDAQQPNDETNKEVNQEDGADKGQVEVDSNDFIGAPDNYDFKEIELPEGIKFDNALAEKFSPVAKKLNLSQQGANELVKMLVEHQQSQLGNQQELIAEFKRQEIEASKIEYQKMLENDKEISNGSKEKYDAYLDVACEGYNAFASDGLQNLFKNLGLDYHPDVVKHFYKLGKLCGNDSIQNATKPAGQAQSAAQILYGDTTKND